jgi:Fur family peroxide stress response transcriptional regulator
LNHALPDIGQITERIREAGLKATSQRIVILNFVLRSSGHPSAEEVHFSLVRDNPALSLATVYQNLDALSKAGLIIRIPTGDSVARFDGVLSSHHHIYLDSTREIIDFVDGELDEMLRNYLDKKNIRNLTISSIRVHIEGEKTDPGKNIEIIS